MSHNISY